MANSGDKLGESLLVSRGGAALPRVRPVKPIQLRELPLAEFEVFILFMSSCKYVRKARLKLENFDGYRSDIKTVKLNIRKAKTIALEMLRGKNL